MEGNWGYLTLFCLWGNIITNNFIDLNFYVPIKFDFTWDIINFKYFKKHYGKTYDYIHTYTHTTYD